DLDAIAAELGDLPLALHMAGSYLKRYRHVATPAAYLAELQAPGLLDHRSLTGALEHSPTKHEQHVARTFALSLDKLDAADPVDARARALLDRAAFFAAGEPIPRRLLIASAGEIDRFAAEDALRRLGDLGLIEEEADGAVTLHRLLAVFVRVRCADADGTRTGVEFVLAAEASRLNEVGLPAPVAALRPHLRAVAAAAVAGSNYAGLLFNSLGYHLQMIGDLAGARAALERALAIAVARFGPKDPRVGTVINNLGGVLKAMGDLAGARAHYEGALAIDEAAYDPHHPSIARDVNNIGRVLQDLGDLGGAKVAFERALAIVEAAYGLDHPNVATIVNNLGAVLRTQRDFDGAKAHFQYALAIDEAARGPHHPNVARDVNNIGGVLLDLGDLAGAKAAHERALDILERSYGAEHPSTRTARENLDIVLRQMERKGGE
ncbi:MAG: tetratricopeptide repeat protein, partial [Rhodospirillales bacterium]|nr:tetratricopeptide repeat protein [Rhodospirillales bacterium]